MTNRLLNKSAVLSQFIMRRERMRTSIWLISLILLTVLVVMTFTDMYVTELERQAIAETMENPAMIAMVGPGYGLDHYTIGAMTAHQMLLFTALAVALMSILFVARHTRSDEENGRIELIRSLPAGRLAPLNATLLVIIGVNVVLSLLIGLSLYALGVESMDMNGSLLYGAALGVTGIFFAAVTAIFAQLSENTRGTIGLSLAFLIVAYLVRAIGDVGNGMLSWFSPLGWVLKAEVYVNNYWWPLVLTLVVSTVLILLAFYLNAIRDLGAGFIAAKPGRKHASRFLQSPFGLALNLQRTSLISWGIGIFVLAASYGSVFGDLESFFDNMSFVEDLLDPVSGFTLTEQFLTMIAVIMAMISTIPVVMAINKLIGEEQQHRVEHVLSRSVSRLRLMGSYFIVSVISSVLMLSLSAGGLWAAGTASMDEAIPFATFYATSIIYLPAIWAMIGLALLCVGMFPRLTSLSWLYLVYSFIVVYLGGLLQFPAWMANLTPFGHIPQYPVEEVAWVKLLILTIISALIMMVGFISYRKRDIHG